MGWRRIRFQDWLVELGYDPDRDGKRGNNQSGELSSEYECSDDPKLKELIEESVRNALRRLSSNEREIVERVHYMGQTYRQISRSSGREISRLESLHRRAVRRLRRELGPLVKQLYGIETANSPRCVICRSPLRSEIDEILEHHDQKRGWRTIMRRIESEYGIKVRSAQTLVGHRKYH